VLEKTKRSNQKAEHSNEILNAVPYFRDHKAQHQKLNASCFFFIHKGAPDYKAHLNEAKLR